MNAKNAVKPTEVTKEAFLAFCESKPADEWYNRYNSKNCAVGQFCSSCKTSAPISIASVDEMLGAGVASLAIDTAPYTFGALAARLRESL